MTKSDPNREEQPFIDHLEREVYDPQDFLDLDPYEIVYDDEDYY